MFDTRQRKLSYRLQMTRCICANAMAWLTEKNTFLPMSVTMPNLVVVRQSVSAQTQEYPQHWVL